MEEELKLVCKGTMKTYCLICLLVALSISAGCSNISEQSIKTIDTLETLEMEDSTESENVISPSYTYLLNNDITLCVDPRVELLYLASEYINETPINDISKKSYVIDAWKVFDEKKEDDYFKLLIKLSNQGFKYGHLTQAINLFDSNHNLRIDIDVSKYSMQQLSNLEIEEELFRNMKKYRDNSTFDNFFTSYEIAYNEFIKLAEKRITRVNLIERVEDFFGMKVENTTIALSPASFNGYSATHDLLNDNLTTLITLPIIDNDIEFIYVLAHELAHRFVDMETKLYLTEVSKSEWKYAPFESTYYNSLYPSWELIYNEYVVRAFSCIIIGEIYGEGEMQKRIEREIVDDFTEIEMITELLKEYMENRTRYPTFSDYSEELIEQFSKEGSIK